MESKLKSLYFHLPFCEVKCHYCDFYSLAESRVDDSTKTFFYESLLQEIRNQKHRISGQVSSIFFGGGTPSLTPVTVFEQIFESLDLDSNDREITIEANPSSIRRDAVETLSKLGVNRVSLGIQSTNNDRLKLLGRVHNRKDAFRALDVLFEAGIENVSTDLICGVPGQSIDDLTDDLQELLKFPIKHLSCYLLTLPSHHSMAKDLPSDNVQLEHLLHLDLLMKDAGFDHYEISNFSKDGLVSQHNLTYWKRQSYLGIGPSAHSYDRSLETRWKNFSSIKRYSEGIRSNNPITEFTETLNSSQIELEKWMLGLRLKDGVPKSWLKTDLQKQNALNFEEMGLLTIGETDKGRIQLTARGFALSDQVIGSLSIDLI